jgi:hypothetical protein
MPGISRLHGNTSIFTAACRRGPGHGRQLRRQTPLSRKSGQDMSKTTRPDTGTCGSRVPAADKPPVRLILPLLTLTIGLVLTVKAVPPMPVEIHLVAETTRDTTADSHRPARYWYSMYRKGEQNADIYRF